MPSATLFLAFLGTTAIFAFIPGPSMLYAAAQTLARGRRSGLMAALGIHLGCYVHVATAAAGLSVLFHAVPVLYLAVKLAGAAYLVWLGNAMFRERGEGAPLVAGSAPKSARRAFMQSVTVEVLNPKTAIFFLAFLPQFIDPAAGLPVWVQFLLMGAFVNLMFSAADLVGVVLAGTLVTRLRRSGRAQRLLRQAGGAVLVGLGFRLAVQEA